MSVPKENPDSNIPTYAQGHHASVTRSHTSRTATNSAAFLLPHLRPHFHILDIGCGPGTISSSLASLVPLGHVTGIDISSAVIDQARSLAPASEFPNLDFRSGDVLAGGLDWIEDGSFDVVYTSQTLLHIPDPIAALKEVKRVLKPNGKGILACREGDTGAWIWTPDPTGALAHFTTAMNRIITGAPGGRKLHAWVREAGFEVGKMVKGTGSVCYSSKEEVEWWGGIQIESLEKSSRRESMMERGVTEGEVGAMVEAFRVWMGDVDAWSAILQCEVLAWT